jgi:DNA replication and repair protein RecF
MTIDNIKADGFRNLRGVDIALDSAKNVLCGDNGAGKTSLLEAVWVMTGVKSFRGAREKELLGFGTDKLSVNVNFTDAERTQTLSYCNNLTASDITANGVKLQRLSKLFGRLSAVIFTPDDLNIAGGEPSNRRQFLNLAIAQIRPSYAAVLSRYNKILQQRNAHLKQSFNSSDTEIFEMWDLQLSKIGAHISLYRDVYIKMLSRAASDIYADLSSGREKLEVGFHSSVYKDITDFDFDTYYNKLKSRRQDDLRAGTTLSGIHRDDIVLTLDGKPVREYASQGQLRSAALSLKLAQAKILAVEKNDPPVVLLDDVLSELDFGRREYILSHLSGFQVLITACDKIESLRGKKFTVEGGRIVE